ncbi:MAG: prephenate dehydratase [Bacteroidetes bacterium]|jgi:prephenate dehydratase|nr:prephenate dehydratase [Bacteroidota bacterium]
MKQQLAPHIALSSRADVRVALLGGEASFHHQAAMQCLGQVEPVYCDSFQAVADAVGQGTTSLAIMAVENTLVGLMLPNLHLIVQRGLHIVGEHYLQIELQLLAPAGATPAGIHTLYSHPYAFQQCEPFLAQYPRLARIERSDTADAARRVAELADPGVAALAGRLQGQHYGLQVVAADVHAHTQNFTRFLVLAKQGSVPQPNKATFWFRLAHQPGSLAHVLQVFALHKLNLTKLTSIAVAEYPNDFAFWVEFTFDSYTHYQIALELIRPKVKQLHILGEYAASDLAPFQPERI